MTEVSVRRRAFSYVSEIGCSVLNILGWYLLFIVLWGYF